MLTNKKLFSESLPARFDGVFEWDFLDECFAPTKIKPMDLDAIIERHGHFLVFETKPERTQGFPKGQAITLKALHKVGCFSIIVLYGKTKDTITKIYVYPESGTPERIKFENAEKAVKIITKAWFDFANGKIDSFKNEYAKLLLVSK